MIPSTILIVDDEPANRRLAKAVLAPNGYRLIEANDGEEALIAVREQMPDLILLDVRMPRRDGFSVCQELKRDPFTRLIPIIMLTSLDQIEDKIQGIELGVDDYLLKPFHSVELTARVKSLLALRHFTSELENAAIVLTSIGHIVDQRDAYTGHHCKRVGNYGASVALAMGLDVDVVRDIHLAGMLHDLGKMGVPDSILQKPTALTDSEREVMQTHAVVGADLVTPMKSLSRVIPFIRHHHERLDGSGYPDGLVGDKIPLAVRIVTVVDIYDALATERPYKKAYPSDQCLAILREEAKRGWWDMDVVENLATILRTSLS